MYTLDASFPKYIYIDTTDRGHIDIHVHVFLIWEYVVPSGDFTMWKAWPIDDTNLSIRWFTPEMPQQWG